METSASKLSSDFRLANEADMCNRARGIRNKIAYSAVNGSLSPNKLKAFSKEYGFSPSHFNFLQKYVRGVAGSFISSWFDWKFAASGECKLSSDLLTKLQVIYSADKDLGKYKSASLETIKNGLIYRGVERIDIVRPSLNDPRTWRIGFTPVRAESVIFDPSHDTGRVSDARKCWAFTYPTLDTLKTLYPNAPDSDIEKIKLSVNKGVYSEVGASYNADDDKRNDRVQIVELYEVVKKKVTVWLYTPDWITIPVDSKMSELDRVDFVLKYLGEHGVDPDDITDETVIPMQDYKDVLEVSVFVPSADVILDQGEDERQIGRLPFFAWSFLEQDAVSIGLVDILWQSQLDVLKRENSKEKFLSETPIQKAWVHPELVGEDPTKLRNLVENWADGSKPIIVDASVVVGQVPSLIGVTPAPTIPNLVMADEASKMQMMDTLSGLTPSMQGYSTRSGESSILYTRKVIEGVVQQKLSQETMLVNEHDKAEAWLKLVPKVYGGEVNLYREWVAPATKVKVVCNLIDDAGNMVDDLSQLDRVSVVIGKSNESDFVKQAHRETDIAMLQVLQPTATNAELIGLVQDNLILQSDFVDEEEKARTTEAVERRREIEKLTAEIQLDTLKAKSIESKISLKKMEAQLGLGEQIVSIAKGEVLLAEADTQLKSKQALEQLEQAEAPKQPQPQQGGMPQGIPMPNQPQMAIPPTANGGTDVPIE